MKNIILNNAQSFKDDLMKNAETFCVDPELKIVYFASESGLVSFKNNQFELLVDAAKFSDVSSVKFIEDVLSVAYLTFEQSVCIITKSGNIFMCNVAGYADSEITPRLECAGLVECGVMSCAWSPDQEAVIIYTADDTLMLMSQSFDTFWEVPVIPSTFADNKQITVGWGAKETQFHGSEGKQAAKTLPKKNVTLLPTDDEFPRLSWHGDGQLFVLSSIVKAVGYRQLRVYDRDGLLQSTSEDVVGIEHSLGWKPSGSLIASSQKHQNKHNVIFFEKNGLQHGEFTLPYKIDEVHINEILWNVSSSILAIWYQHCGEYSCKNCKAWVELWTVNNYHWYLKQTIHFDCLLKCLSWDPEKHFVLHALTSEAEYLCFEYSCGVNKSSWFNSLDQGVVAVIDGKKLLITPFRNSVVPPPMSAEVILCEFAVNQVIFEPNSNNICIVLSNGNIEMYNYDKVELPSNNKPGFKNVNQYRYNHHRSICLGNDLKTYGSWFWLSSNTFILTETTDKGSSLREYNLTGDGLEYVSEHLLEDAIELARCSNNTPDLIIQLINGSIMKFSATEHSVLPFVDEKGNEVKFPVICNHLEGIKYDNCFYVFGLNAHYQLFCGNNQLAKDCTSFITNEQFLLYTTHQHILRCIALKDLEDSSNQNVNSREVERGSQLIVSIPYDTKVILQMPRGNLETIHPRPLVLAVISSLLDSISYKKAFEIMRRNRINMNLIYDHNPDLFLKHTEDFINQLNDSTSLCLFLSELENRDICTTMYTNYCTYSNKISNNDSISLKVNVVCDAMKQKMEELNFERYLLPILTCLIKKNEPEIELSLSIIQKLFKNGKMNLASDCLKHLLYIVDVNKLYDHALGMYDFDIVIMVAEKSQKDPKEYLPFLNELKKLEENYQRFKIDSHLKRYERALKHLSKCNKQSEFMAFMEAHELHVAALKLFSVTSDEYLKVAEMYAERLEAKKSYEEAAIWYSKAKKYSKSVDCFISAKNWRLAIAYAYKASYDNQSFTEMYLKLIEYLKNSHNYLDAAHLMENYMKNAEDSIVLLIEGHEWDEALATAHRNNRLDLIETNIKPAVVENVDVLNGTMQQIKENFETYQTRLVNLRVKKQNQVNIDDLDINDADADLYSDISSVRSQSSRSSGRSQRSRMSSKSRKKLQKKKYSLREGSQYEEEALIIALSELIDQTYKMKDQIHKLSVVLCLLDFEAKTESLQFDFDKLLTFVKKQIPNIWPEANPNNENLFDPTATTNSIVNSMKNLNINETKNIDIDMMRQMLPPKEMECRWNLDFSKKL